MLTYCRICYQEIKTSDEGTSGFAYGRNQKIVCLSCATLMDLPKESLAVVEEEKKRKVLTEILT